ncbi:MAG: protein jag [Chloroflexota bacterium]|nr:MAG: protein jag [Chloroflexota bacterium]
MNDKRTNLEVIAPSVEEAIEKGLDDLGLPRQSVDIEILDEGGKGLFGLGNRQARVRLTIKSETDELEMESDLSDPGSQDVIPAMEQVTEEHEEEFDEEPPFIGDDYVLDVARDVVSELLEKMKVRADVTAEYVPTSDARSRVPVRVNVQGDDLSYLIGRQAETLNALQYISSLIINKEIGRSVPLIVDVEGYRIRRENQLRQLARQMADQAVSTGRRQVLEPMPANERRIVHIELRDNPGVETESIGEDPRRKVTIIPQ